MGLKMGEQLIIAGVPYAAPILDPIAKFACFNEVNATIR